MVLTETLWTRHEYLLFEHEIRAVASPGNTLREPYRRFSNAAGVAWKKTATAASLSKHAGPSRHASFIRVASGLPSFVRLGEMAGRRQVVHRGARIRPDASLSAARKPQTTPVPDRARRADQSISGRVLRAARREDEGRGGHVRLSVVRAAHRNDGRPSDANLKATPFHPSRITASSFSAIPLDMLQYLFNIPCRVFL